jgi:hypothetical protein
MSTEPTTTRTIHTSDRHPPVDTSSVERKTRKASARKAVRARASTSSRAAGAVRAARTRAMRSRTR